MEVRLEYLRPRQIEAAMATCPTLFMPLGTVEWHGLHNVVGLDALKAHALCVEAAKRAGGLVAPALFGGMGGLHEPFTFAMEEEVTFESRMVRAWFDKMCMEAARHGFKAVIMLTGHYGAVQQVVVREAAVRASMLANIPVLGTPEYFLALDAGYTGDHAAFFETSLMMHLYPDSVELDALGEPPYQGVGGRDPKAYANAEEGKRLSEVIVERLAFLATAMPKWNQATRNRFVMAEQALVSKQMTMAGEHGSVWAAWRKIGEGAFAPYAELLTSERFEAITELVNQL